MNVFDSHEELNSAKKENNFKSFGLVPTMGALHKGHITLIKRALKDNELVIVSIFVNPTQFDNSNDLENYPRTLEKDLLLLKELNANIWVYAPKASDLYRGSSIAAEKYDFGFLEKTMEGISRSDHFQGVATVVQKLFEVLKPSYAYFGEKDYQQLLIVNELVYQKKIPVKIISCPIVREADGLAMSSRNARLSEKQRTRASIIYKTLLKVLTLKKNYTLDQIELWVNNFFKKQTDFELEYFCIVNTKTLQKTSILENSKRAFIAVKIGEVRLIDNIKF